MEKIKESLESKIIAKFMGYLYYHPGVDIDNSDCGGIYDRMEIFSKTPILVDEYPEDDQYSFREIPNPDYGNINNPRWRHDIKHLSWASLNHYITKLNYDKDWNNLIDVIEKIEELGIKFEIVKNIVTLSGKILINDKFVEYEWYSGLTYDTKLISSYIAASEFCKWYFKQ